MRRVLFPIALAATFVNAALAADPAPRHPRHVLFLMCDQHNPDALGRYGDPGAVTPALDALAAAGTSFRRAYCQNPVCSPARNAILLSRYSHSMGVHRNGQSTPRDLISLPQFLRSKGFRAACFGKLHVQDRTDLDWDLFQGDKAAPEDAKPESAKGWVPPASPYLGAPSPLPENETPEWKTKERTIAFMKAHRDDAWFIQCSMEKPHPPFTPPQRFWNRIDRPKLAIPDYPDDDLADAHPRLQQTMAKAHLDHLSPDQVLDGLQGYYGNLAFADAMLGEVLKAVDDLGLRGDTLVVYTADHGEMLRHHHLWKKHNFFRQRPECAG